MSDWDLHGYNNRRGSEASEGFYVFSSAAKYIRKEVELTHCSCQVCVRRCGRFKVKNE